VGTLSGLSETEQIAIAKLKMVHHARLFRDGDESLLAATNWAEFSKILYTRFIPCATPAMYVIRMWVHAAQKQNESVTEYGTYSKHSRATHILLLITTQPGKNLCVLNGRPITLCNGTSKI